MAQTQLQEGPLGPAQTPSTQGSGFCSRRRLRPSARQAEGVWRESPQDVGGQAYGARPRPAGRTFFPKQTAIEHRSDSRTAFTVRKEQRIRGDPNGVGGNKSSYSAHVLFSPKLYVRSFGDTYVTDQSRHRRPQAQKPTRRRPAAGL